MNECESYNPRILVVDDEQAILDEFREILSPSQDDDEANRKFEDLYTKLFPATCPSSLASAFDVELCRQGDEALEKVQAAIEEEKPFAVMFVDVRMPPGPDGVWTAEQIRAVDPHIQIVVVTAYSDIDPLDISHRVRPADKLLYLQKPFHPHEIRQFAVALTSKWLGERQLEKHTIELTRSNEQLQQEIAEHKRTEQKRQLLSRAIMSTEDCVYITDMNSRIIFVNQAFCETYQYSQKEIVGKEDNILAAGKWRFSIGAETARNFRSRCRNPTCATKTASRWRWWLSRGIFRSECVLKMISGPRSCTSGTSMLRRRTRLCQAPRHC
jgi:CheY-like chemotaxis protein